jgi:hypothetical protein
MGRTSHVPKKAVDGRSLAFHLVRFVRLHFAFALDGDLDGRLASWPTPAAADRWD